MITAREVRERCFCDNSYVDEVLKDIEAKIIATADENPNAFSINYVINDDTFSRFITMALENNGFIVRQTSYESSHDGKTNLIHITILWWD